MINRHDIPAAVKHACDIAMERRLIDAWGLVELFTEHIEDGGPSRYSADPPEIDYRGLINALTQIAYVNRHSPEGVRNHADFCAAADAFYDSEFCE